MKDRPKSKESYSRLLELLPGGVNSPVRSFKGMDISPLVVARGEGDLIYDIDGHQYIDYCGSWGPLIHGHAHPEVIKAATSRMALGTTFGITTEVEGMLAKTIIDNVLSIESIRFVSSGTEAAMSAVRLARGFTGRDLVVKFSGNYHGHADLFLVQAGSGVFGLNGTSTSAGVPEETIRHTICLPYNDEIAFRSLLTDPQYRERIAAVIVEPIAGNMGCVPASRSFLHALREETSSMGAVLIFDEVITGFRVGMGGAQALYGIVPDLTCFGKIIGGGFPAAAFGGIKEIMDNLSPLGAVYQAGTLSGNPVAMEAGLTSLQMVQAPRFYERLNKKADSLTKPVKEFILKNQLNMCLQQIGSMFTIFFGRKEVNNMEEASQLDFKVFSQFFRYMLSHGVYFPPSQVETSFVSMAHTEEHLEKTRDLILEYLKREL